MTRIEAVVFDLDGVLLDSEQVWDRSRRQVVAERHGRWNDAATAAMQGMSSAEWARYMRDVLGVDLPEAGVIELVLERLVQEYEAALPLLPGATEAVERLGQRWPLGLASSSNRVVIDRVLAMTGMSDLFDATVSSEEVPRGKPSPDVYLEAARRLGRPPRRLMAVEDSANGIRAAVAAGLAVAAVPNREYPPPEEVLRAASLTAGSLHELTVAAIEAVGLQAEDRMLDEEEAESFPASDPHSDWAGPPG